MRLEEARQEQEKNLTAKIKRQFEREYGDAIAL